MKLNIKSQEKNVKKIKIKPLTSFNQKFKNCNNSITNRNNNKLSFIEEANLYLLKRVNECSPYYNINKWEKDFEQSQYYKKNHCQLPIINFKKYRKQNKANKIKYLYRNNSDKNNIICSNLLNEKANNSSYFYFNDIDEINNNIDYISLHFFLNNKSIGEHSYIIITSLNELFSEVIKKLFKAAPSLNKDNIIGFISQDNDKINLLELDKTVMDNDLNEGSKIIIQFK